jgi:DNA-binding MarR family transcriptional regulator
MKKPSQAAVQLRKQFLEMGRHRAIRDPLAMLCDALDLTGPQSHALLWLGEEGSLTMGALSHRSGITEKSMTGVIDRLEQMGLLERVRSTEDRRSVSVVLTAKGKEISKQLVDSVDRGLDELIGFLGPEDHRALLGVLVRTAAKVKALRTEG